MKFCARRPRLRGAITDFPGIEGIDIDPLMAFEKAAVAVDGHIALSSILTLSTGRWD